MERLDHFVPVTLVMYKRLAPRRDSPRAIGRDLPRQGCCSNRRAHYVLEIALHLDEALFSDLDCQCVFPFLHGVFLGNNVACKYRGQFDSIIDLYSESILANRRTGLTQ